MRGNVIMPKARQVIAKHGGRKVNAIKGGVAREDSTNRMEENQINVSATMVVM